MRIAKSIKYDQAYCLSVFSKLNEKINKLKNNNIINLISSKDLNELNYFLIIECKDISFELGLGKSDKTSFSFFVEKEKNKKFLTHIRKKNSQPYFFKKIGLLYDIEGCYLVATTKSNKKKITITNSSNTISCKLDMNKLPKEIESMCIEFEQYQTEKQKSTHPEIEDILGLTSEEREKIIESIVSGISLANKPKEKEYPNYNFNNIQEQKGQNRLNIEQIIESKLSEIYDIPFLEQVIESGIKSENFELCSKVRDRINFLKKIK